MTRRYRRNPLTAGRVIDGQAFVVTSDDNKLHTLNRTAARLWQIAADAITPETAAKDLCEHFEVEYEKALSDCKLCLEDLVARGIIVAD